MRERLNDKCEEDLKEKERLNDKDEEELKEIEKCGEEEFKKKGREIYW